MHAMALPSLWHARGRPGNALDNAGLPRCTHPDNNSASRLLDGVGSLLFRWAEFDSCASLCPSAFFFFLHVPFFFCIWEPLCNELTCTSSLAIELPNPPPNPNPPPPKKPFCTMLPLANFQSFSTDTDWNVLKQGKVKRKKLNVPAEAFVKLRLTSKVLSWTQCLLLLLNSACKRVAQVIGRLWEIVPDVVIHC